MSFEQYKIGRTPLLHFIRNQGGRFMNQEVYKFIEQADDFLKDAEYLMTGDRYKGVVNRSYYAIFAAVQALLLQKMNFLKRILELLINFIHFISKQTFFQLTLERY